MAYDPATGQVILVGGEGCTGYCDDGTWVWENGNWTDDMTANTPVGRIGTSLAYDPASGQLVYYGGDNPACSYDGKYAECNDTWAWNGSTWTESAANGPLDPYPPTSSTLAPGGFASMAYDAASESLVLYGGDNAYDTDTWHWNGSGWTGPDTGGPCATGFSSMAQDAAGGVVMIGGYGVCQAQTATWLWSDATRTWTALTGQSPPARSFAAMAYDPLTGQDVLFGGSGQRTNYDDTWLLRESSSYPTTVSSTPGLLAYWRLGESSGSTAFDQLGAHNGNDTGGYTLGVPGAIQGDPNTAVSLNGSSGQVQLPSLGATSDWTVEGWTDLSAGASQNTNGNNALYATSLGVRLIIRPTGYYADDLSTGRRVGIDQGRSPSNIGAWVYWALVRSGSTLTVYRDGVARNSSSLGSEGPSNLNGDIGSDRKSYFLHGGVDEVAIYDAALTPATLLFHYELAGYGG